MATPIPSDLAQWVTEEQWKKLALHQLSDDDRESVLRILRGAFEDIDRKEISDEEIADNLAEIQGLADDYREEFDDSGYDEEEVGAANHAVEQIAEEDDADAAK